MAASAWCGWKVAGDPAAGEKWLETLRLRCGLVAVRGDVPKPWRSTSLIVVVVVVVVASNPRLAGGGGNGILVTCLGLDGATREEAEGDAFDKDVVDFDTDVVVVVADDKDEMMGVDDDVVMDDGIDDDDDDDDGDGENSGENLCDTKAHVDEERKAGRVNQSSGTYMTLTAEEE